MKETSIKWNDGRCENEEGIVKCVRKIHQEIYPREINFMPVAILRDFDSTSPGAACSKSNRFMKFPS